jgi:2-oxoglutarate ferredoxin oxidoreductase subunit alpha
MHKKRPSWAFTGADGLENNIVTSLYLGSVDLELLNQDLQLKLARIKLQDARYEEMFVEDAEIIVVAFGTAARVAQTAVQRLRQQGINIGLFRPVTLWPFPEQRLTQLTYLTKKFFVVEMNAGQMVHDVREIVGGQAHVQFVGRMGGTIPMPDEVETAVIDWLSVQEER